MAFHQKKGVEMGTQMNMETIQGLVHRQKDKNRCLLCPLLTSLVQVADECIPCIDEIRGHITRGAREERRQYGINQS